MDRSTSIGDFTLCDSCGYRVGQIEQLEAENGNLRAAIEQTWRSEVNALRAENERLRALEAVVREYIDHRELAWHLRQWLAPIDQQQDDRDTALLGMNISEPESC